MERSEILTTMGELKLYGMKSAYAEIIATAVKRQHDPERVVGDLLTSEIAEKQARSIKYQLTIAKLPLAKDLEDFDFAGTQINETLVRDLAGGNFLAHERNVVLIGGTGTGKTHLAIAIARAAIRNGARGRFFNLVDLVNKLEAETRAGRQERMADYLGRKDFVVLDELGYRRIHVMLQRHGIEMNLKMLRRLYGEERLQVRKRGGRKRALGTRRPMLVPDQPNQRWSLDFVSDSFTDGRRFRVLTVVDDHTRECLALIADTSLSGLRVGRELDAIIAGRGLPRVIVSDNGTEFTSMAILRWSQDRQIDWHYIAPGKPMQNCRTASSRASTAAFATSASTRCCSPHCPRRGTASPSGRRDYNSQRPHSSLGNLTPNEFATKQALEKQAA